jgi:hypothetical protein
MGPVRIFYDWSEWSQIVPVPVLSPNSNNCCSQTFAKILFSNLGVTGHRMILDSSLTTVCLGLPGRCILITYDIHQLLWLISMFGELKWLISKPSLDSSLHRKVTDRLGILSFLFIWIKPPSKSDRPAGNHYQSHLCREGTIENILDWLYWQNSGHLNRIWPTLTNISISSLNIEPVSSYFK